MKKSEGLLKGVVICFWLFSLTAAAADGGHARGPDPGTAPSSGAPGRPTWKDRATWRGRPSPLQPLPEGGDPAALIAVLEQNQAITDEGLRLLDEAVRDPVANKKALVDAFEDFVLLQEAWSSGVDSWISGIASSRKKGETDDAKRYTKGLADKLRLALLRRFDGMVKEAEKAGVDLKERAKVSAGTRLLAQEAADAVAKDQRDWWMELLREDFVEKHGKPGDKLPADLMAKVSSLSNADLNQLLDLMNTYPDHDYDHPRGEALLLHPERLTSDAIHELHQKYYRPFKLPYEVLPPLGDNLPPLDRRTNLKQVIADFPKIEKELREDPITRKRLTEKYDTYMKQTTGKSLTEIFKAKGLELDYLSSTDDRWIVLNAMKNDILKSLSASRRGSPPSDPSGLDWYNEFSRDADQFAPRLKSETPQWGDPSTYDGRPTPFLEPAPKPAKGMTKADYEARAKAQIARETRERTYIGDAREREIRESTMQPWREARKAALARNASASRLSGFASDWAVSYVNQKGITRHELARLFDGLYAQRFGKDSTLTAQWDGELDRPATATDRQTVFETELQYARELDKATLDSNVAWGLYDPD